MNPLSRLLSAALVAGSLTLLDALPAPAFADGNSDAAKACQKGGHALVQGTDGRTFANTGECVSFVARGGQLVPIEPAPPPPADF